MTIRKKYLLDTDTCSYIIKRRPLSVIETFEKVKTENIFISIITYSELLYGVEKSKSQRINLEVIEEFINLFSVLEWDRNAAKQYAKIRSELEKKGNLIGNMDLMIAAHALSHNLILVTNNQKHFSKISHLNIENWVNIDDK